MNKVVIYYSKAREEKCPRCHAILDYIEYCVAKDYFGCYHLLKIESVGNGIFLYYIKEREKGGRL